jgi:hypothetical protein
MSNAILYAGLSFMLRPVRQRHQLVPVANRDDQLRTELLPLGLARVEPEPDVERLTPPTVRNKDACPSMFLFNSVRLPTESNP